jgi:hypothetical protein
MQVFYDKHALYTYALGTKAGMMPGRASPAT